MRDIGQQCDHELEAIGRHRVCRACAAVYAAVAGPSELTLLGGYTAVLALLDEYRDLQDDVRALRTQVTLLKAPA